VQSAATVFQEDLYLPAPSGTPSTTSIAEWVAGAEAPISYMSLQPEGMVSVFDISLEQGGKDFEQEIERKRLQTASQRDLDSFVPEAVKALPVPQVCLSPQIVVRVVACYMSISISYHSLVGVVSI
jgi:hypothetical protein